MSEPHTRSGVGNVAQSHRIHHMNAARLYRGTRGRAWTLRACTAALCCLYMPLSSHVAAQDGRGVVAAPTPPVLRPGDKVRVRVWQEPELSGEFVLPADGVVSFPKVGRVAVAQLSVDSLTSLLTTGYAAGLRNPSIEVTPLRRVRVLGAVRNPGYYYADPTISVAGALVLAGGVAPDGNDKRIDLIRHGAQRRMTKTGGAFRGDSPVQSGDELAVPERSWASRNVAFVTSAVTGVALVAAALVR